MAGPHPFLEQLRAVARGLDDEALAAMASKGLLRRAQKDLETAQPAIISVSDNELVLQVSDATVRVPPLLTKATCDCPATGACRHVLTALVYLREMEQPSTTDDEASVTPSSAAELTGNGAPRAACPPVPERSLDPSSSQALADEPPVAPTSDIPRGHLVAAPRPAKVSKLAEIIAALTDEEIQRWAGKPVVRKAIKMLATKPQVAFETSPGMIVRFPTRNITCRWVPGVGLAGAICSCPSEEVCEHLVAAVLAWQASLGKRSFDAEPEALAESSGAPRSRAEVLASVAAVVRELVSLGLSRVSNATAQRLTTLAISAHGVDLPRLERLLKSLADEVQRLLRRDAQASATSILSAAARIEALRVALETSASAGLVGRHQSQFHEVGQITLVGVGAQRWRSRSGFHGLTVYFWNPESSQWNAWNEMRPIAQPDFSPAGRFDFDGPWPGCDSPREASQSVLRLSNAWRNPHGRLSSRASVRGSLVGKTQPSDLPNAIDDWSRLTEPARAVFVNRLSERTENQELVLLLPTSWGAATYDTLRQELLRPVLDARGRAAELWLPFEPEYEEAIGLLEKHQAKEAEYVFGTIRLVGGRLRVQPISLISADAIVSLNLSAQRRSKKKSKSAKSHAMAPPIDEGGSTEDSVDVEQSPELATASVLGRVLTTAMAELETLAEAGIAVRRDHELLGATGKRLDALGLTSGARRLAALLEQLANRAAGGESPAAGSLLQAYYVLSLAANEDAVRAACAAFT